MANLIVRLPIECAHLAPYVYGGGGYQFEPGDEWFAQVGAGVDVRVTQNWGLFVDARYVIPRHGNDQFGVGRVISSWLAIARASVRQNIVLEYRTQEGQYLEKYPTHGLRVDR